MTIELRLLVCLTFLSPALGTLWWENALIYQVYTRSFKDSNGDGIGDIKGIADNADYFKTLGVTAVWLSPIYTSPKKDFGYDVSNYVDVDPDYGTLQDFDTMVKALKDKGIKVMLDFIPNHSSDQHEWFKKSCQGDKNYTDYYIWRTSTNNWKAIFPDGTKSAWNSCNKGSKKYYHVFGTFQPDLNYRNPKVLEEMTNVLKFWMDRGVDGFRMDAVPYLVEDKNWSNEPKTKCTKDVYACYDHKFTMDQPETYTVLKNLSQAVYDYVPKGGNKTDRVVFFEAYTSMNKTMKYYDSLGSPFNFNLITDVNMWSNATDFKRTIDKWMSNMPKDKTANWVIGNHDNHRVGTRFGPEMIDAMNMLNLLLPGSSVTYYGEELGMVDAHLKASDIKDISGRDGERTPFQWSDELYAGFMPLNQTSQKAPKPWLPVNPNYWEVNKKKEEADERSHLKIYKSLVALKKKIGEKSTKLTVHTISDWVLAVERASNDSKVVVLVNLNNLPEKVNLTANIDTNKLTIHVASLNNPTNYKGSMDLTTLEVQPRSGIVLSTYSSSIKIFTSPILLLVGIFFSVVHYF